MVLQSLNNEARAGKFPPFLHAARKDLLLQVLAKLESDQTFCVVLVGDKGVGKKALLHLLALELIQANCESQLRGMPMILANAEEFIPQKGKEKFLQSRLWTLGLSGGGNSMPIVCLPEIQQFLEKGVDSGNFADWLLAPRNKWITTIPTGPFVKYIATNSKWSQRGFSTVEVGELSEDATREIALLRQRWYHSLYGATVESEAVDGALRLSKKYFSEGRRPGIVLDLLESACARVSSQGGGKSRVTLRDAAEQVAERKGILIPWEDEETCGPLPPPERSSQPVESPAGPVVEPRSVLVEPPPAPVDAIGPILQHLAHFLRELERRSPHEQPGVAAAAARILERPVDEQSAEDLDRALAELLSQIDPGRRPPTSGETAACDILRELACFTERVNRLVLHNLNKYARFVMDNEAQLPHHKSLAEVLLAERPRECDPAAVRAYLVGLYDFLEVLIASTHSAAGEVFNSIRNDLHPTLWTDLRTFKQKCPDILDRTRLMGEWEKWVESYIRKTVSNLARRTS